MRHFKPSASASSIFLSLLKFHLVFVAKIDSKGCSLDRSKNPSVVAVPDSSVKEVIAYGGLGATVEPELLDQVKNLCKRCGEYRSCEGECTTKT